VRGCLVVLAVLTGPLLAVLGGVVSAGPAYAHATLLGTDPPDGSVLPTAPNQITLTFNERVELRPGAVRLLDAAGNDLAAGSRAVDTRVVVTVPSAARADGSYIVNWRVISVDTHPVAGAFTFSVGAPSAGAVDVAVAQPSLGVRLVRQVTEATGYAGVLGSVGLTVFGLVVLPPVAGSAAAVRRRMRMIQRVLVSLACAAMVAAIPVTIAWQDGDDLGGLLDAASWRSGLSTETALTSLLVVLGLGTVLAATAAAPTVVGGARHRPRTAVAFSGAGLALGALALVGHTRTAGPAGLVLSVDLLHMATAAVWFGGLIGLGVVLARASDATPVVAAGAVAGFSRMAAGLVVLVGVAGVLLGWRILESWSALFGTSYGVALIVKVAAVLTVLAIAGWNRYRLVPRIAAQPEGTGAAWRMLRRTVRAEALLLVAVLVTTGVLVTQSPVESRPPPTGQAAQPVATLTAGLGSGRAVVRLTPGRVGINSLELTITDANRRPIAPVAPPQVRVTFPEGEIGPLDRPLSQTGPGRYEAVADFPLPGAWIIDVSVRTSKYENPIARIPVNIR
jgi:copper transport protein